jgi:anthranilate phosphoribosyltransferase
MSDAFKPLLGRLADGATLSEDDAEAFFSACLRGEPTPAQVAAAVTAIRLRGETVGEIALICQKVMGAYALSDAYDMERHVRDLLGMAIVGGSSNMQRNNIAALMGLAQ